MKLLVFFFLVIAAASALRTEVELKSMFSFYQQKYSKVYADDLEASYRYGVWKSNLAFVEAHNDEAYKGLHSFTLEMNHLADMTNQEYRAWLNKNSGRIMSGSQVFRPLDAAPDAWDWRAQTPNIVPPVKNQGSCGSCWAFSAVATIEGAVNQKTGELHTLSEQQLVDCTMGGEYTCSTGGIMSDGVAYVISAGGIESEKDYAYKGTSGGGCKFDKSKIDATISSYANITFGDEASLKEAAYTNVVSVGIDASSIWFQLYFSGVYDSSTCSSTNLDHGVAVVGYGHDTSKNKDYWIVRNSWGGSWGQSGYIWMRRNANNQCGIASEACVASA